METGELGAVVSPCGFTVLLSSVVSRCGFLVWFPSVVSQLGAPSRRGDGALVLRGDSLRAFGRATSLSGPHPLIFGVGLAL